MIYSGPSSFHIAQIVSPGICHTLAPLNKKVTGNQLFSYVCHRVYSVWHEELVNQSLLFFFFFNDLKITDEEVTPAEPKLRRLSFIKRSNASVVIQ